MAKLTNREKVAHWELRGRGAKDGLKILDQLLDDEPDLVLRIGELLLKGNASLLGSKVWDVLERTFLAALHFHKMRLAHQCLEALAAEYPPSESQRVALLVVLELEAFGRTDQAQTYVSKLIRKYPDNQKFRKRKVCMLKSESKWDEAIKELTSYLEIFQADLEAWSELADLHWERNNLQEALFCLEEVLLTNPHDPASHCKCGEILSSIGGSQNVESAQAYFLRSLELKKGGNRRAMLGLLGVASPPQRGKPDDEAESLRDFALECLKTEYGGSEAGDAMLKQRK